MEIELNPPVDIQTGAFNLLVSPEDIAIRALRSAVEPKRFLVLYVCGNRTRPPFAGVRHAADLLE